MSSGDPRSDLPTWLAGMAIGIALILIAVVSYQFGSSRGEKNAEKAIATKYANPKFIKVAGVKVTTEAPEGGEAEGAAKKPDADDPALKLFATTCGGCHTLGAADTKGTVGPNLDTVKPDDATVKKAITDGGLSGSGAMPAGLLKGKDEAEVAKFVSTYAGQ